MASYQARRRDPLVDQNMQAAIERRGKELLGAVLLVLGAMVALMLISYSPEDPSWFSATDHPVQNLLGRFGAAIAAPLFVIGGRGSWGVALVLCVWGVRLISHRGEDRAVSRSIFAPIAVAMMSVTAATQVAGPGWDQNFGLGGLFGDTVLGALLGVVPASGSISLTMTSLLLTVATLVMLLFVLGFSRAELRLISRRAIIGLIMGFDHLMRMLGTGAAMSARTAQSLQEMNRARRESAAEMRAEAAMRYGDPADQMAPHPTAAGKSRPPILRAEPRFGDPDVAAPMAATRVVGAQSGGGLLSRLPGIMRRVVDPEPDYDVELEPELIERHPSERARTTEAPSPDRISSRIADAVRARGYQAAAHGEAGLRVEPPVTKTGSIPPQSATLARVAVPHQTADVEVNYDDQDADLPDWDRNAFANLDEDDDDLTYAQPTTARSGAASEPKRNVVVPSAKAPAPSRKAEAEKQPSLRFDDTDAQAYELPPLGLLSNPANVKRQQLSNEALEENARMLESVLDDYGVKGEIVSVRPGPVVTMYELEPAPGLKASRVIGLADDIARSMSALSARVSTVPGRTVIGIELPNAFREKVVLREILAARDFGDSNLRLPLALGKDIAGEPVVANLAKMPHLLIAGTTGSGKSVAINTMILSLLYKLSPDECRLIMIDPKMLELSVYDGIPHLLSPVVTDPKKAVVALKWVVGEMEERYRKMSKMGVRNIDGYNGRVREALANNEMFKRTVQTGFDEESGDPIFETEEFEPKTIPYIVVIVDEMADLMMVAGKEIEACIQRLAQMARASGIHLIMATQRPSVDVITGTIKANFPTRISFQVTSKIDSRTILGEQGAEQLLGMGDMLYMAGGSRIVRIHGPFVSDEEVEEVVNHLKSFGPPEYMSGVVEGPDDDREGDIDLVLGLGGSGNDLEDALYDTAVAVVLKDRKVSTSYIQRKLAIGYNKAARLVEQMEEQGLVSPANHVGKREILVPEQS
jgi:DNA segregation ATPase FtsK/SpoIIIE, S-DNA-T family